MTQTKPLSFTVDDLDGQTVEATARPSGYHGQAVIELDTDADAYRKNSAILTPAAARALAAKLIELADLADDLDD